MADPYHDEALAKLRAEIEAGDASAYIPFADELCEAGHPHGDELCMLASSVASETDPLTVVMAIAVFEELVRSK